jgi:hypothetical protein
MFPTLVFTHVFAYPLHSAFLLAAVFPPASFQAGGTPPLRHASDVAMSSLSGTEQGGTMSQPPPDDAQVGAQQRSMFGGRQQAN